MNETITFNILVIAIAIIATFLFCSLIYVGANGDVENAKVCHNMNGIYSEGKCEIIK